MPDHVSGLHHVTAVAGDPSENLAFYRDALGLRLVKRTVNFDDVSTYHLYYGDETGTPGTAMTFFPFAGARAGRVGSGQVTATAFVAPEESLPYWRDRLPEYGGTVHEVRDRFDTRVLPFEDPEGQPLELVAGPAVGTDVEPWPDGPVPVDHAVRGFYGVTLTPTRPEATVRYLDTLGYELVGEEPAAWPDERDGVRARYRVPGERATVVDVLDRPDAPAGRPGVGTVHHVAFRTPDGETQREWRETVGSRGTFVTPVKDRQYFTSIYFREPGGVLFEIATECPGFTVDEDADALGSALKLPEWLEDDRERIEAGLPPLDAAATTDD